MIIINLVNQTNKNGVKPVAGVRRIHFSEDDREKNTSSHSEGIESGKVVT